jgi:hypothetical protein
MSQSDLTIQNQSFPSFRADLNDALSAINSFQSGTSRPASAVVGTIWLDTTSATTPTLKYYDGADDISLATLDHASNTVNWLDSTVAFDIINDITPQLGGMLDVNGQAIGDGTLELIKFSETASAVNEITITNADTTNAPEISATGDDTDIDLKLTPKGAGNLNLDGIKFPNADGTAGQLLQTDGSGVLSFATVSGGSLPFKNIVINGDMQIAQRGTTKASIGFEYGTVDRWQTVQGGLGAFTQSQSTDVPTGEGFAKSLKMDCTTADASPASGDELYIRQLFEGQNLQYLKKGTANAVSLTASFWVKSTKTGTFILELFDSDNTRQISKSYTVIASDTWEKKTITFEGDTTGAFTNDNSVGLGLNFWLGAGTNVTSGTLNTSWDSNTNANRVVGQVNIADSTSNDWYITGVQLEAGTTDTDFEFLPFDVSLGRCQRYYYLHVKQIGASSKPIGIANYFNSTILVTYINFTEMRTDPSLVSSSGTNIYGVDRSNTSDNFNSLSLNLSYKTNVFLLNSTEVSGTAGQAGNLYTNADGTFVALNAEL